MRLHQPLQMTRDDTAVLFIDYQVGLLTGVRDVDVRTLRRNLIELAHLAKALHLPVVASTTARGMWGPTIAELKFVLGGRQVMDRPTVNPWDFPPFAASVEACGRTHLVVAGLCFETCLPLLAISARQRGYRAVVAIDACGTFTAAGRKSGIERLRRLHVDLSDAEMLFSAVTGAHDDSHSSSTESRPPIKAADAVAIPDEAD